MELDCYKRSFRKWLKFRSTFNCRRLVHVDCNQLMVPSMKSQLTKKYDEPMERKRRTNKVLGVHIHMIIIDEIAITSQMSVDCATHASNGTSDFRSLETSVSSSLWRKNWPRSRKIYFWPMSSKIMRYIARSVKSITKHSCDIDSKSLKIPTSH